MILQKNSGGFFIKNFRLNCCEPGYDIEKEEINDLSTFRLTPNITVNMIYIINFFSNTAIFH